MRTLIILVAFLFIEKLCIAQFFNKRFAVESKATLQETVVYNDGYLYVIGSNNNPLFGNGLKGYIMKSDMSGNFIDSAFITLPGKSQISNYSGCAIVIDSNRIAFTGYTFRVIG